MNRPFEFISLGGCTDSSYLEGHDYTYEGAKWGKIVDVLIKSQCMNPIIYFDELDKISKTEKGDEIINVLMHLIDTSQNHHFTDKYFSELSFDLSKAIFVFSYNNVEDINPILLDRIVNIELKGFNTSDKIKIANNYLIKKIEDDIGLDRGSIKISDKVLEFLIDNYTSEDGVRKLKERLYFIFREINLRRLRDVKSIKFPFNITQRVLQNDIFKNISIITD
ncbi:AAA family ATPase [bacterium]|nr:AAA family ATPase [bacterium]